VAIITISHEMGAGGPEIGIGPRRDYRDLLASDPSLPRELEARGVTPEIERNGHARSGHARLLRGLIRGKTFTAKLRNP